MPQTLTLGAFILGAILLFIGLVGGGFKLFGAEIPVGISCTNRKIAFTLGILFIAGSLLPPEKLIPQPPPAPPSPKTSQVSVVADIYVHPSGSFERQGEVWVEYPPFAPGRNFRFKEALRDERYIYLYDELRHKPNDLMRVSYLRIPVAGGMAQWSYSNPFDWQDLYPANPKTQ